MTDKRDQRRGPKDRRTGIAERRAGWLPQRRVIIVGQATVLTEALAGALDNQPGIEVVAIAEAVGDEAHLMATAGPDVAVITAKPRQHDEPPSDLMADVRRLQSLYPDVRVVILAGEFTPDLLVEAAGAGVSALLPFATALSDLIVAVRTSGGGNIIMAQSMLIATLSIASVPEAAAASPDFGLTRREMEILGLLGRRVDVRTIASILGISIHTCRGHVKRLLRKLGAHSQVDAVAKAARAGVLASTTNFAPRPLTARSSATSVE